MKPARALLAHALIASIALAGLAVAQNQQSSSQPDNQPGQRPVDIGAFKMVLGDRTMDDEAAMAQWMELGQPGEAHQFLTRRFVGQWNVTMRMFAEPGAPAMESKGQAWFEPVLNGRHIEQKLAVAMMGMPYEGLGHIGFDNNRRVFYATWMDSMSTGVTFSKGSINPAGDQITLFSEMDEPSTGEIGKVVKYVYQFPAQDTIVFSAWEVMYGDPWKVFEIEYNRKPAKPASKN